MRIVTSITISLVLAACATAKNSHWEKPGASNQEFNMDAGQCRAQAFSIPNAPATQIAIVYGSCMNGKGWYLAQDNQ